MTDRMLLLAILTVVAPPIAYADAGPPQQPGFSAKIRAGVGYKTSTDQLGTANENERTNDLRNDADRYDSVLPLVLFDLRYTFPGAGTAVYFGTPFGTGGPPGLALGVAQPLSDGSELDASVWTNPLGSAWEDPYLVDEDRDKTRELKCGVKINYQEVLGTGFGFKYSYGRVDVNNDKIGERFGALERDGSVHKVELGRGFSLPARVMLEPALEYSRGDLDGGANRFDGYGLKLGIRRFSPSYGVILALSAKLEDYAAEHPIFGKSREDRTYSVFGMFNLPDLLGNEHFFSDLLAGYSYRDSNIGFLDARTFFGGLTIGFEY